MTLNEQLERDLGAELDRDEGERLKPYKDSRGFSTIGIGHLLEGSGRASAEAVIGHPIDDAVGITREEEIAIFNHDIDEKIAEVFQELPWSPTLDEPRLGALINLAFNMGVAKLITFATFLGFVKRGQFEAAAADLHSTLWASQVGKGMNPPGRATRICQQIEHGIWI